MYFCVLLVDRMEYVVIPREWLQNGLELWENFVNYGIKKHKVYHCFWSNNETDKSGRPNLAITANFDLAENVYMCRILMFCCK